MKEWQFNVLFFVGVGGAVFLLIAPAIGLNANITNNPTAITGVGTILAYVLTQRGKITNSKKDDKPKPPDTTEEHKEDEDK